MPPRSPLARAALGVAVFALAVWNGVFDLLLTRGERDYLVAQARHAARQGPAVVMHDMMAEAVSYAALVATWWAAACLCGGLLLIWYVRRTAPGA